MQQKSVNVVIRMLVILFVVALAADVVAAQTEAGDNAETVSAWGKLGAGIAFAAAALGTGISQGQIGAAAVGMVAEDQKKFPIGILFIALPETILVFGFVALFLL